MIGSKDISTRIHKCCKEIREYYKSIYSFSHKFHNYLRVDEHDNIIKKIESTSQKYNLDKDYIAKILNFIIK